MLGLAKLIGNNGEEIPISESEYQLLRQVVQAIKAGDTVHINKQNSKFTTQEAADFLNVSHTYLIKLLQQGKIPYIQVGSHRHINLLDVTKYKEERNKKRRKGMQELSQFIQEEGFYNEDNEGLEK